MSRPTLPTEILLQIYGDLIACDEQRSLTSLMSTSLQLYDIVSSQRYRRIRLTERNFQSFLLGLPTSSHLLPSGRLSKTYLLAFIVELDIVGNDAAGGLDGRWDGADASDILAWALMSTTSVGRTRPLTPSLRVIRYSAYPPRMRRGEYGPDDIYHIASQSVLVIHIDPLVPTSSSHLHEEDLHVESGEVDITIDLSRFGPNFDRSSISPALYTWLFQLSLSRSLRNITVHPPASGRGLSQVKSIGLTGSIITVATPRPLPRLAITSPALHV